MRYFTEQHHSMNFWNRATDWLIDRAAATPYFDLPGYMIRTWLLGGKSPRRNDDNPGFLARPTSRLYAWITDRVAIRVHHILRSDREAALHDHPFSYVTLILRGGYWEVVESRDQQPGAVRLAESALPWLDARHGNKWRVEGGRVATFHGAGTVLWRPTTIRHKLVLPHGRTAVTLFIVGPRRQTWGFYTSEGKVPGKLYGGKGPRGAMNGPIE
jgi:hypothetical protein